MMGVPWAGWLGGFVAMLAILLLIALLVVLVVWLVRPSRHVPSAEAPAKGSSAALEIARERYARGEISREEFLRLEEDLKA